MNKDLISIIIPVYNTEKYLEQCINSAINQTYTNTEILIINDGSTDDSEKIILKYVNKDKRIKYFKKEKTGCGDTRNHGINNSKGNYIYFMDSDDYIDKTLIEKLHDNIKPNDSFCGFVDIYMDFDGEIRHYERNLEDQIYLKLPSVCTRLYNKKFIDEANIRFSDAIIGEDLEFNCKLILHNNNCTYIKEALYYYRVHNTSTFHNKKTDKLAILKAINNIEEYAKTNNKKEQFYEYLEFINICHILRAIKNIISQDNFDKSDVEKALNYLNKNYPKWEDNNNIKGFYENDYKKIKQMLIEKNLLN